LNLKKCIIAGNLIEDLVRIVNVNTHPVHQEEEQVNAAGCFFFWGGEGKG